MQKLQTQVVVVGGGAGGFGTAYTLAKHGVQTILVEKNPGLGGTSVYGGVNCWEPGVADGELHHILKDKLYQIPNACAVCKTVPNSLLLEPENEPQNVSRYPWGLSVSDEEATYEDTLKRCLSLTDGNWQIWRRFQFEPDVMNRIMQELLEEHKEFITLMLNAEYLSCETVEDRMTEICVRQGDEIYQIRADYFVDSTGNIILARDAGCEVTIGTEGKEVYGEPSAGARDEENINGVSYVFRIRKSDNPEHIDPYITDDKAISRLVVSCFNLYPNGDINVNMLPTLTGREYLACKENADEVGRATVLKHWHFLQTDCGMKGYELVHIFPMAGVRESYRLVGKYVLTEHDLIKGVENQIYDEDIATIADHQRDRHGENSGGGEMPTPYAIPISCTEAKEFQNLFVACRGASFSSIAASSARLTRTMLGLGEAVGREISKRIKNNI